MRKPCRPSRQARSAVPVWRGRRLPDVWIGATAQGPWIDVDVGESPVCGWRDGECRSDGPDPLPWKASRRVSGAPRSNDLRGGVSRAHCAPQAHTEVEADATPKVIHRSAGLSTGRRALRILLMTELSKLSSRKASGSGEKTRTYLSGWWVIPRDSVCDTPRLRCVIPRRPGVRYPEGASSGRPVGRLADPSLRGRNGCVIPRRRQLSRVRTDSEGLSSQDRRWGPPRAMARAIVMITESPRRCVIPRGFQRRRRARRSIRASTSRVR
jgi:hypothetical protein